MLASDLIRADLHGLLPYGAPLPPSATTFLGANESPWPSLVDPDGAARCYPPVRSVELAQAMGDWLGAPREQVLPTRGADEAIDLLIRTCCAPGADAVLVTPPTFGMYAATAALHGLDVVTVPGLPHADSVLAAVTESVRVIFLCTPGNPTGEQVDLETVRAVAQGTDALVVVDEAYFEYSGRASALPLLLEEGLVNVAVLRTLSKAHALAGARVGCAVGAPELIRVMTAVQPPYALPSDSIALALAALEPAALAATQERVKALLPERARVAAALGVDEGGGNFVWLPAERAEGVVDRLSAAGIVVSAHPTGVRISIGSPEDNDRLISALT